MSTCHVEFYLDSLGLLFFRETVRRYGSLGLERKDG